MKRLKKMVPKLIVAFIICCVLLFCYGLWDALFAYIFPWTRTRFADYQSYNSFLEKYRCYSMFVEELPADAREPKYYWHHESREVFTAYSTVLPEETFKTLSDGRQDFFRKRAEEFSLESVVYSLQNDHFCGIDNPKWLSDELINEEELEFINKVIESPEARDQYYYLVVFRSVNFNNMCYNGVILNDTTHEFIEFRAEVSDPNGWHR